MITISIFMVLAAETMYTAIEKTVDLVTREFHPLAKQAKNMAAGAVLLAAVNAIIIGLLVFVPYLF
jgi:diacylglycerol kinase